MLGMSKTYDVEVAAMVDVEGVGVDRLDGPFLWSLQPPPLRKHQLYSPPQATDSIMIVTSAQHQLDIDILLIFLVSTPFTGGPHDLHTEHLSASRHQRRIDVLCLAFK